MHRPSLWWFTVHHSIRLTPKHFAHALRPATCVSVQKPTNPRHSNRWARVKAWSERAIQEFYRVPKTSQCSAAEAKRLHLFNIIACWVQCMNWKPHTCWCPRLSQQCLYDTGCFISRTICSVTTLIFFYIMKIHFLVRTDSMWYSVPILYRLR